MCVLGGGDDAREFFFKRFLKEFYSYSVSEWISEQIRQFGMGEVLAT